MPDQKENQAQQVPPVALLVLILHLPLRQMERNTIRRIAVLANWWRVRKSSRDSFRIVTVAGFGVSIERAKRSEGLAASKGEVEGPITWAFIV